MKNLIAPTIILGLVLACDLQAASYDTLPRGVNTLVFKQVLTSKIESRYNANGDEGTLDLKEEFSTNRIQDISSVIKSYFEELKTLSPEAYTSFSLGEFSANIEADVTAQGLGFGHGLTDKLTIYGSLPVYHITTNVDFRQSKESNLAAVQATIRNANPDTAMGKFVKDLTLQLPNSNAELLQSLVVNYYGYKPIGKWEKDALGDAEIGFIYRLTDFSDKGIALSSGLVLPTGQSDDPDSLQDVSTGDGQVDTFLEIASGVSFDSKTYELDLKTRYTYQFESDKSIRLINDESVPLSRNKSVVKQKLGNNIDATLSATYNPTYWLNVNSAFLYSQVEKTNYANINDQKIKSALESNTEVSHNWLRLGIGLSSVESYKRKKIEVPFEIGLSLQKLLNAKNTAKYNRVDFDFKLYF